MLDLQCTHDGVPDDRPANRKIRGAGMERAFGSSFV